jgi:4-amino-4-deoxy-L-arabinose transferase-like glycosyltransferase
VIHSPKNTWSAATSVASLVSRADVVAVAAALCIFAAAALRLPSLVVSEADEGTYVYAGRLITEGLLPYEDFMFAHPPMIAALTALAWRIVGEDLLLIRLGFLAFWLTAFYPLVSLTRMMAASRAAPIAAAVLTFVGLLFMSNMGRSVRLEPVMLVFLLWGTAAFFAEPRSTRWQLIAGAAFAAAALVKLTAILPVFGIVLGELLFRRHGKRAWIALAVGGAVTALPVVAVCLSRPHFFEWVFLAHAQRPRDTLGWRLVALASASLRCPLLPAGVVCSVYQLLRGREPTVRALALATLSTTLALAFVFKSVATYYFALAAPFATVVTVVTVHPRLLRFANVRTNRWWYGLSTASLVAAVAFVETYHRFAALHVSEPLAILPSLASRQGPIWTMVPDFALAARRPLVSWYYIVDSYLPRLTGALTAPAIAASLAGAETAVLFPGEFSSLPEATEVLHREFDLTHAGPYWFVWERRH